MDPQDIRSLQILEEIEDNYNSSQRDLARKLNISLGLVNSFMKRLAKKGYVKITTIPKNSVKYILTPQGFAEKSRLTYEFIQYSFRFYKKAFNSLEELLNDFQKRGIAKVALKDARPKVDVLSPQRLVDAELALVVLHPSVESLNGVEELLILEKLSNRIARDQPWDDKSERVGDKDDRQKLKKA